MPRVLTVLLLAFWIPIAPVHADDYGYPIEDPFVATVVGTPPELQAEFKEKVPFKRGNIVIFEDREIPDVFWYQNKFHYVYALQKEPAPLIFIIGGTGASDASGSVIMLARAFYEAGFHVATLASPTHMNFIVTASRTTVPGHVVYDAEDLYRAMERIRDNIQEKVEITEYFVTGYSLGGMNTAFVTWLDEQRQAFNFSKALMINPPVRLYSSISLLDRMLENIPGGLDNFDRFFNELVEALTKIYKESDKVDLSENALYDAYEILQPDDEELAALIGVAFRLAASNLVFTADVMNDYGYIKPRNIHLTRHSSLDEYSLVTVRTSFTDFYHDFFYPFYKAEDPTLTREGLIRNMSLEMIEDYLRGAEKIQVMTNVDDIILEPGQVDFFRDVFGERARIFPRGGHLGNMEYRENVDHMVNVFRQ